MIFFDAFNLLGCAFPPLGQQDSCETLVAIFVCIVVPFAMIGSVFLHCPDNVLRIYV